MGEENIRKEGKKGREWGGFWVEFIDIIALISESCLLSITAKWVQLSTIGFFFSCYRKENREENAWDVTEYHFAEYEKKKKMLKYLHSTWSTTWLDAGFPTLLFAVQMYTPPLCLSMLSIERTGENNFSSPNLNSWILKLRKKMFFPFQKSIFLFLTIWQHVISSRPRYIWTWISRCWALNTNGTALLHLHMCTGCYMMNSCWHWKINGKKLIFARTKKKSI